MLKYFAEKMWVAFAVQKLLTFFQQKNIRILCIESTKTANEMTLNELVKLTMLWTTGPWYFSFFFLSTKAYYVIGTLYISVPYDVIGTSNEYLQYMFSRRCKKNIYLDTPLPRVMSFGDKKLLSTVFTFKLRTLGKIFQQTALQIFFSFFPENRFRYFMQIVSKGDNLHDMSNPVFWEK